MHENLFLSTQSWCSHTWLSWTGRTYQSQHLHSSWPSEGKHPQLEIKIVVKKTNHLRDGDLQVLLRRHISFFIYFFIIYLLILLIFYYYLLFFIYLFMRHSFYFLFMRYVYFFLWGTFLCFSIRRHIPMLVQNCMTPLLNNLKGQELKAVKT